MQSARLYVGNLNYDTSEETLRKVFSQYGEVVSVNIIGRKGFGFVEMGNSEAAEKAKNSLNQTELDGRTIRVDEARPRREGNNRGGNRFGREGNFSR
ncbi:MAG: RNA-binding protein [Elusimicrobia bacterium]|nr:RNA-binding protein [Elusimicrobiota bacterium]